MKILFKEKNPYSWRKILTFVSVVLLISDCLKIWINIGVLPASHLAIISGVFMFYFGKEFINNLNNNQNGLNK